MKRILSNPHIAGWRSYNGGQIMAPGNWPPLVPLTDFEAAQAALACRARVVSRGSLSLLGGIATCRCNLVVNHAPRKGYGTYRCSAYKEGGAAATGPHVAMKGEIIDQYVSDVLVDTLSQPDAVTLFAGSGEDINIPALKEHLNLLDKALQKLSLQNAMGQISDTVFAVNAAEIGMEKEKIDAQVAEASQVNVAAVLVFSSDVRGYVGRDGHQRAAGGRKVADADHAASGRRRLPSS